MKHQDLSRIEAFRQLKRDIRGSQRHIIVGVDIAKDRHHAFFGASHGRTLLRRLVFENSREGFEKLLANTESLGKSNGLDVPVFGLEPTGDYHKPLAEFLIRKDQHVVLTSGVAVRRNRELLDGRWDKNDTKDAANVADLVSQGKFLFYDFPCREIREIQSLVSLKIKLKKLEHGLRVRIRNHLVSVYFPELDRYCGQGSAESLAIIRQMLDPARIAGLDFASFWRMATDRDRGLKQQLRLTAIHEAAGSSVGCVFLDAADFEARIMVENLEHIRRQIRNTDKIILGFAQSLPSYELLLSIPGFGPDISSKVIAALGNPARFGNHRQVIKMAGFDLSAARSGKTSDAAKPVLSKRGKAYLRYALYQGALVASTRNVYFMKWFANRVQGRERERGIKTKMRVKLAAKMLVIAWTLMKNQQPFDPAHLHIGSDTWFCRDEAPGMMKTNTITGLPAQESGRISRQNL